MKFPAHALRSFTSSSEASFLFLSWRKKEMSTSKKPSDRKDTASPSLDRLHHRTHQQDDKQPSDRNDTASPSLDHHHHPTHQQDDKQPSDCTDTASPSLDHRHHPTHQQDDKQPCDRKDTTSPSLDHRHHRTHQQDDKQPSDCKDTATPGLDHHHHCSYQQDDKQPSDCKDTATSNFDHPSWIPLVLLPPSAKKQSALFSLPLEKKRICDHAFVSRKRYLGLSTLVVLLLAFTNVSHIAEAKSEVDTLHQLNYSERTLNHFESASKTIATTTSAKIDHQFELLQVPNNNLRGSVSTRKEEESTDIDSTDMKKNNEDNCNHETTKSPHKSVILLLSLPFILIVICT